MAKTSAYQYDVFISYSHLDRPWVEQELLPRIENADLKVCIFYRDFRIGLFSQINMEEAAKNSRHTIAVLTQNWVDSDWSQFGALVAILNDPVRRSQRLIPLLLKDCRLPERIRLRTYADFRVVDEQAW
ncbi:MAG: toll/interleukin-1 receptor domain-containing protein [Candidatus Binatia bacterium]